MAASIKCDENRKNKKIIFRKVGLEKSVSADGEAFDETSVALMFDGKDGSLYMRMLRLEQGGHRSIRSIDRPTDRIDRFDRFDNFSFVRKFLKR